MIMHDAALDIDPRLVAAVGSGAAASHREWSLDGRSLPVDEHGLPAQRVYASRPRATPSAARSSATFMTGRSNTWSRLASVPRSVSPRSCPSSRASGISWATRRSWRRCRRVSAALPNRSSPSSPSVSSGSSALRNPRRRSASRIGVHTRAWAPIAGSAPFDAQLTLGFEEAVLGHPRDRLARRLAQ